MNRYAIMEYQSANQYRRVLAYWVRNSRIKMIIISLHNVIQ